MKKETKKIIVRELIFWIISLAILFSFFNFINEEIRDILMEGLGYFSFGYIVGKTIQFILKKR